MTGRSGRAHGILRYPAKGKVAPTDFLEFAEAPGFYDDCVALGIDDDDLMGVQFGIMLFPNEGILIEGCGGLRRLLCRHIGLNKEFRVFYTIFDFCSLVLFYGVEPGDIEEHFSDQDMDVFRELIASESRKLAESHHRAGKREASDDTGA